MQKPFAITLDVGFSSLANHTGSWRTERPVYLRPPAALQPRSARPARTSRPGCSTPNQATTRRLAHLVQDNPFPAIMGRVCYHTCEGACNRGKVDRCRHQLGRALSGRPGPRAGLEVCAALLKPLGQKSAGGRGRALGAVGRLPPGPLGHKVTVHEAGPHAGRHDAFWHSPIPTAPPGT
jgi:hypothetical protein